MFPACRLLCGEIVDRIRVLLVNTAQPVSVPHDEVTTDCCAPTSRSAANHLHRPLTEMVEQGL